MSDAWTRRVRAALEELPAAEALEQEALADVLGELEEAWDDEWLCEMDKAWDAIHRVLGDGSLEGPKPPTALGKAVLGGECIADELAWLVSAEEVPAVAEALAGVDEQWFKSRFDALLQTTDYDGPGDEDDREYSWSYFCELRELYRRAAAERRAMLFSL